MADQKTERGSCGFAVQQGTDGKPVLVVKLYQDTIPALKKVVLGFAMFVTHEITEEQQK